ncbi:MAG: BREX system Lon protease-like protein BrxL [Armatimonadota bacterium]
MEPFEQIALDNFGEVVIRKDMIRKAGFGARAIPTYVGEWILSDYIIDGSITELGRLEISQFISKYLPQKGQKNEIKNRLINMDTVYILDDYSVNVNLNTSVRHLRIPILDLDDAYINSRLVDENPLLLVSGVWGVGELFYIPPDEHGNKGQVWMRDLEPFQIGSIDADYYKDARSRFTLAEWINLLISSMGFNPLVHTDRQKMLLLTRILPLVEPRTNLVELAPKGTGKSFVFDNVSRYARVVSGGRVSAPVLFHHNVRQTPGLITRYDVVVLDEVQSVNDDSTGELVAGLKVYLESGRYSRGNTTGTAESGMVLLGNILLDENRKPMHSDSGIFNEFPNFLRETAFVDRLHGLLPGWELPRVTKQTPSNSIGFKGDFFSEILHQLRSSTAFADYATHNAKLTGCDDLRDQKAIIRLATGFMKLLYPDMGCSTEEFTLYCLRPAVELRQRIRDELHKMDQEFAQVSIGIEGLDSVLVPIEPAPIEPDTALLIPDDTLIVDTSGTTISD